jgi:hypothetical protein
LLGADTGMMDAATPPPSRALALILEHCASLNSLEHGRPTAVIRLRQEIGEELARLLLTALAGDHSTRPRDI